MTQKRSAADRTIFIFDLHDVLVKKNYCAMVMHIIKHCYRIDFLLILLWPRCIIQVFSLLLKSRVPEQYVIELARQYPRISLLTPILIAMMNEQIPIQKTLAIVQSLKKQDYQVYLFSNIGERTFKQFSLLFPSIIQLFDKISVVQEYDNWIQKPYPVAFEKFIALHNIDPHQCVFIDNSKKNIAVAHSYGFRTILYRSPEKLHEELQRVHFLQ